MLQGQFCGICGWEDWRCPDCDLTTCRETCPRCGREAPPRARDTHNEEEG